MVSLALKLTSGGVWAHKIIINHGAAAAAIVAISASLLSRSLAMLSEPILTFDLL